MKKLLLSAALAVGVSTAMTLLPSQQLEASAKSYDMKSSFAQALKKGTLPNSKGKVGETFSSLHKKAKGTYMNMGDPAYYKAKDEDSYNFDFPPNYLGDYIPKNATVNSIGRWYNYKISKSSVEKYFGKAYKGYDERGKKVNTYIYKTGKYYTYVKVNYKSTEVIVGTKMGVCSVTWVDNLYK
ncbi:hypothetical protein [Kurthia huakuii]|uniref:hypothetical protein n=1 Tax=Kurthia huakuii TaxID=1421019 RepID=UPI000496FEBB|nr:hypothetical protein [Kurthia huakuii]MBM7701094.1 hypothetical protein [Kurthia huakuii]